MQKHNDAVVSNDDVVETKMMGSGGGSGGDVTSEAWGWGSTGSQTQPDVCHGGVSGLKPLQLLQIRRQLCSRTAAESGCSP